MKSKQLTTFLLWDDSLNNSDRYLKKEYRNEDFILLYLDYEQLSNQQQKLDLFTFYYFLFY